MHSGLACLPTLVDNNMVTSTWWMHDGSFLRLKTVELGYTFSQKALKKIGVQSLRLYLTGSNLLTFSKFKLWDEMEIMVWDTPSSEYIILALTLTSNKATI